MTILEIPYRTTPESLHENHWNHAIPNYTVHPWYGTEHAKHPSQCSVPQLCGTEPRETGPNSSVPQQDSTDPARLHPQCSVPRGCGTKRIDSAFQSACRTTTKRPGALPMGKKYSGPLRCATRTRGEEGLRGHSKPLDFRWCRVTPVALSEPDSLTSLTARGPSTGKS